MKTKENMLIRSGELFIRNASPKPPVPSNSMQQDNPHNLEVVPTKNSRFTVPGRTESKKTTIKTSPTRVTTTTKSKTDTTTVTSPTTIATSKTVPTTTKGTQPTTVTTTTTTPIPTTVASPTTITTTIIFTTKTTAASTTTSTTTLETTTTDTTTTTTSFPYPTPPEFIRPPEPPLTSNKFINYDSKSNFAFGLPVNMLPDEKSVDIYIANNPAVNHRFENTTNANKFSARISKGFRKGNKNGNAGDLGDIQEEFPPGEGTDFDRRLPGSSITQNTPEQAMKINYKVAQEFETQPQVRSWAFRENNMLQNHIFDLQYNNLDESEKKKTKSVQKAKTRSWTNNQIDMQKNLTKEQYNNFEKNEREIASDTFKEQYKEFENLKKRTEPKSIPNKDFFSLPLVNNQETSFSTLPNIEENEMSAFKTDLKNNPQIIENMGNSKEKIPQQPIIEDSYEGSNQASNNSFQLDSKTYGYEGFAQNIQKSIKETTSKKVDNTQYFNHLEKDHDKTDKHVLKDAYNQNEALLQRNLLGQEDVSILTAIAKNSQGVITTNSQTDRAFMMNSSQNINEDNQIIPRKDESSSNMLVVKRKETQAANKRGKEAYLKGDEFILDSENDETLSGFFKNTTTQNERNELDTDKKFAVLRPIKLKQISGPPNPIVAEKEELPLKQSPKLRYLGVLNDDSERSDKFEDHGKHEAKQKDEKMFLYKKLRGDSEENFEAKPSNIYVDNRVFIYGGMKGGKEILPTVLNTVIKKDKGGEEEIQRRIKLHDFSESDAVSDGSSKSFVKKKDDNSVTFEIDDTASRGVKEISSDQDKKINMNNLKESSNIFIEKSLDFGNKHRQEKAASGMNPVIRQLTNNFLSNTKKENLDQPSSLKNLEQIRRIKLIKAQAHNSDDVTAGKFSTSNLKFFLYKNGTTGSDLIDSYGFVRDGTGGAHRIFGTNEISEQMKQSNTEIGNVKSKFEVRPIQSSINTNRDLAKAHITKANKDKFDSFSGELGEEQQPFYIPKDPSSDQLPITTKKNDVKKSEYVSPINQEQLPGAGDKTDFLDMTGIYEPLKTLSHSMSGLLSDAQKNMGNIPGYTEENKKTDEQVRKNGKAGKILTQSKELLLHQESIRQKIEQPAQYHTLNEAALPVMDKRMEIKNPFSIKNAPTTGADKRTELMEVEEEFAKEESKAPSPDPILQKIINHMKSGFAIKTSSFTKGVDDKRNQIHTKQLQFPQTLVLHDKSQYKHTASHTRKRKEISDVNSGNRLKAQKFSVFNISKLEDYKMSKNINETNGTTDFASVTNVNKLQPNANVTPKFTENSKLIYQSSNKLSLNQTASFFNALDLKNIVVPAFTVYKNFVKNHDLKKEFFNGIFPEPQEDTVNQTTEADEFSRLEFGSRARKFKSSILDDTNGEIHIKTKDDLTRPKRQINIAPIVFTGFVRTLIPSKVGHLQPSNLKPMPPVGHDPDDSGSNNSAFSDFEASSKVKKNKSSSENESKIKLTNTKKSDDEARKATKAKDEDGIQEPKDDSADTVELERTNKEDKSLEQKTIDTTFEAGLKETEKNEESKIKNVVDNDGNNFDLGAQRNFTDKQKTDDDSSYGNITIFNYPINVTALEEGIMQLINQTTPTPKLDKGKEQSDYAKAIEAQNKKYPELKLPQKHGEYIPPDEEEYQGVPIEKPKMASKNKRPTSEYHKTEEKNITKTRKTSSNQTSQINSQSKNGSENKTKEESYTLHYHH